MCLKRENLKCKNTVRYVTSIEMYEPGAVQSCFIKMGGGGGNSWKILLFCDYLLKYEINKKGKTAFIEHTFIKCLKQINI